MVWLFLFVFHVQAAVHSFTSSELVALGSYSGILSSQAVVYNKFYTLYIETSMTNSSYYAQSHTYQEISRGTLGPADQAVAAGLPNSPNVGLCWIGSNGLLFNVLSADGALLIDKPFNVTQGKVDRPAITQLKNGNLVIVWAQDQVDGESWGVFARIFDKNAAPVTNVISVNVFVQGTQTNPTVVGCEGGFIVVWESKGFNNGLVLRKFGTSGQPLTQEQLIVKDYYAREPMLRLGNVPTLSYLQRNNQTLTDDLMILSFDAGGNPRTTLVKGNWGQTSTNMYSYGRSPSFTYDDNTILVALQEERYDFSQAVRLIKLGSSGCALAEVYANNTQHYGSWRVLDMVQVDDQSVAVMFSEATNRTVWKQTYLTPSPSVCYGEKNNYSFQPWTKPESGGGDDDGVSTSSIIIAVIVSVAGLIILLIAVKVIHWIYKKREKNRLKRLDGERHLSAFELNTPSPSAYHHEAELSNLEPDILAPDIYSIENYRKS